MSVGNKELFVTFRVDKSDYFKRDGPDVHTEAAISVAQSLLGGSIRIQGLYEDHVLQVRLVLLASHRYLMRFFCFDKDQAWHVFAHEDSAIRQGDEKSEWLR